MKGEKDAYLIKLENEVEGMLEEEEMFWKMRSREDWLRWGDKNTKWFHSRASFRKRKNEIKGIEDRRGTWVEEEEEISEVATNYFMKLSSSSQPNEEEILILTEAVDKKLTSEKSRWLDSNFPEEDIEGALKSMNPTKAPGPDGAHAKLYQKCWDIIGEDTVRVCLGILNHKESMEPINNTLIALIQKTKEPKRMAEYRPISLCNVIYKIIAKSMANRMKRVFDTVIALNQSTFVPGRQMTDNVIAGFECIHALNNKRRGKTGHIALKLDMSKAYARVEWTFIEEMMKCMNFSEEWTNKVMQCISSVSYSILINGSPQEEFRPSRGLRQGDPLSPYLFLLCAEGFSTLLKREESLLNLSGFQINKHCPILTHLFFADDILVFLKAKKNKHPILSKGVGVVRENFGSDNQPRQIRIHDK